MHSSQGANKEGPKGLFSAKTAAERKALERTRKASQGLKEVRGIWLCPEDEKKLKEYALLLQRVRAVK